MSLSDHEEMRMTKRCRKATNETSPITCSDDANTPKGAFHVFPLTWHPTHPNVSQGTQIYLGVSRNP